MFPNNWFKKKKPKYRYVCGMCGNFFTTKRSIILDSWPFDGEKIKRKGGYDIIGICDMCLAQRKQWRKNSKTFLLKMNISESYTSPMRKK